MVADVLRDARCAQHTENTFSHFFYDPKRNEYVTELIRLLNRVETWQRTKQIKENWRNENKSVMPVPTEICAGVSAPNQDRERENFCVKQMHDGINDELNQI